MRSREEILFDINNWAHSNSYGITPELACIAETLLDIRELLQEKSN